MPDMHTEHEGITYKGINYFQPFEKRIYAENDLLIVSVLISNFKKSWK